MCTAANKEFILAKSFCWAASQPSAPFHATARKEGTVSAATRAVLTRCQHPGQR